MNLEKKLSFLILLMAMLTHAAVSVSVDEKAEAKNTIMQNDYMELFKTLIEIGRKLKELLDEAAKNLTAHLDDLGNQQDFANTKAKALDILNHLNSTEMKRSLQILIDELSNLKLVEASTTLAQQFENLIKQDLAKVKAKTDDIFNHTGLAETKNKFQAILMELSKINLAELYKKLQEQSKNFLENEFSAVDFKFNIVLNEINSTETRKELHELWEKLSKLKLGEALKKLHERWTHSVEQELSVVKAKFDDILKEVNPFEVKKKFQNLFNVLSRLDLANFYKALEEDLKNITEQEIPDLKTKVDAIFYRIDSDETKKKLRDALYELSILNMAEVSKRFELRLKNFVERELPGVKAETDDILVQINSSKTKQRMEQLFHGISIFKLIEISKNLTAQLANLLQPEMPVNGNI